MNIVIYIFYIQWHCKKFNVLTIEKHLLKDTAHLLTKMCLRNKSTNPPPLWHKVACGKVFKEMIVRHPKFIASQPTSHHRRSLFSIQAPRNPLKRAVVSLVRRL